MKPNKTSAMKQYIAHRHHSLWVGIISIILQILPMYVPAGCCFVFPVRSQFKGTAYTRELLSDSASPTQIFHLTLLWPHTFHALLSWLEEHTDFQGGRLVSAEEKLLIFLAICAQGFNWRMAAELFGHSTRMISL